MARDYFVFHAGRSVVPGGMYDKEGAKQVAFNAATRHPGRTYTVMQKISDYRFSPKGAQLNKSRHSELDAG